MLNVRELCEMAVEPFEGVKIWCCGDYIYIGTFADILKSNYEFCDARVESFGVENGKLCVNIDGGDRYEL